MVQQQQLRLPGRTSSLPMKINRSNEWGFLFCGFHTGGANVYAWPDGGVCMMRDGAPRPSWRWPRNGGEVFAVTGDARFGVDLRCLCGPGRGLFRAIANRGASRRSRVPEEDLVLAGRVRLLLHT